MSSKLIFSTTVEHIRVPIDSVVYIEADGNYSTIFLMDGHSYTVTMQLGQIELSIRSQLEEDETTEASFIRIGKSIIVNLNFISYINPPQKKLTLSDCKTFRKEIKASKDALKTLKDNLEELAQ